MTSFTQPTHVVEPRRQFALAGGPRNYFRVCGIALTVIVGLVALLAAVREPGTALVIMVVSAPVWGLPWLIVFGSHAELDPEGLAVQWAGVIRRRIRWNDITHASIGASVDAVGRAGRAQSVASGFFGFPFYIYGKSNQSVRLMTDAFGESCLDAVLSELEARGIATDVSALTP